ncbi:hypothetical protein BD289DRAFT_261454 [Coniella lustricola]|uniref:Uncharacterized protein n=1 Tax=Coniella lustricola TaxID=2025994 RepID=A0A2T3A7T3_9PEZI|nr:hypothetical protein BD289DRAFT_261454 [Coniella lustricola]
MQQSHPVPQAQAASAPAITPVTVSGSTTATAATTQGSTNGSAGNSTATTGNASSGAAAPATANPAVTVTGTTAAAATAAAINKKRKKDGLKPIITTERIVCWGFRCKEPAQWLRPAVYITFCTVGRCAANVRSALVRNKWQVVRLSGGVATKRRRQDATAAAGLEAETVRSVVGGWQRQTRGTESESGRETRQGFVLGSPAQTVHQWSKWTIGALLAGLVWLLSVQRRGPLQPCSQGRGWSFFPAG